MKVSSYWKTLTSGLVGTAKPKITMPATSEKVRLTTEQSIHRLTQIQQEIAEHEREYGMHSGLATYHQGEMNKLERERIDLVKSLGIHIPRYDPKDHGY
jgi:hypothetical protein